MEKGGRGGGKIEIGKCSKHGKRRRDRKEWGGREYSLP